MASFTLFNKLLDPNAKLYESASTAEVDNTPKIRYQQYEIDVDKETIAVSIPVREAENFETAISTLTETLNAASLKTILRKFRGIKN